MTRELLLDHRYTFTPERAALDRACNKRKIIRLGYRLAQQGRR
jgi:hypothetical protein